MKLLVVLVAVLVIDLANAQNTDGQWGINLRRRQCKWINQRLVCFTETCTASMDGKRKCTTSSGPLPAGEDQTPYEKHTNQRSCNWITGKKICTFEHCILSPNGQKKCTRTKSINKL